MPKVQNKNKSKLELVKNYNKNKKGGSNKSNKMTESGKLSYWCIGIIVIILMIYFLSMMISEAEVENTNKINIDTLQITE